MSVEQSTQRKSALTSPVPQAELSGYLVVVPSGSEYATDLLGGLLTSLLRRWIWIAIGVLAGTATGFGISVLMTPLYRAEVTAIAASNGAESGLFAHLPSQIAGLASLAGISPQGSVQQQEVLATLSSFDFTKRFIEQHGLMPELFPESASEDKGKQRTIQDAFKLFDERIRRVYVDEDAGVIRIRIYWTDPNRAAEWANALVRDLNAQMRRSAIANAERSIGYLQEQLAKNAPIEIKQGVFDLIQSQLQQITLAQVQEDYALRIVDPAIVRDPDKYVRPMPLLYCLLGAFAGAIAGVAAILLSDRRTARKATKALES
jgi:uncharacterized protein involved in exopolysaccharide biosynthesis